VMARGGSRENSTPKRDCRYWLVKSRLNISQIT
jgi:hypothetical protein